MIKIGIELNNVVRDINTQIIKYYKKDFNKEFDDKNVDKNVINIIDTLEFEKKKDKYNFLYVDYPYEVFGCAKATHRNMGVLLNNWILNLEDEENDKYDVSVFSLLENALTIQSSYFFLSKLGCRVRNAIFPKDGLKLWDSFDVLVTTNERIAENKPEGKVVILIKKNDNLNLVDKCDLSYDNLSDLLTDKDLVKKIKTLLNHKVHETSTLKSVLNKVKKMFN